MKLLDIVALIQDLPEQNLYKGQVGTIVEVYEPEVFEVEFVDTQGKTYAIETLDARSLMQLHYLSCLSPSGINSRSLTDSPEGSASFKPTN